MASYGGSMADIFISYARADVEAARRLAEVLEGHGWSVWWDRRIPTGRRFDDVIDEQLSAARCVVALWSKAGVASHWVREEAADARERGILAPVFLEAVRAPLGFRSIQSADLDGWRGDGGHPGLEQLVEDIVRLLDGPAAAPVRTGKTARAEETLQPTVTTSPLPEDLPDFSVFRDIDEPWCPEMVVLPPGEFMMGSPDTDTEAKENEKPQHKVVIGFRFAVGRYPVTFEEYDWFCEALGYEKADDGGRRRGRRPVIHVNWNDARTYVAWLRKETGKLYRLLSEAEWEYACRAGTETRFSCDDIMTQINANFGKNVGKTTQVGSYPENPWGLFDMHGNVWEWVEDTWHENYTGAPDNGDAWTTGGEGDYRVARGGSWYSHPRLLRSARRNGGYQDDRLNYIGFRVARTL